MVGQDPEEMPDFHFDIELFLELAQNAFLQRFGGLLLAARNFPETPEGITLLALGNEELTLLEDQRRPHFQNRLGHKTTSNTKPRRLEEIRFFSLILRNFMSVCLS